MVENPYYARMMADAQAEEAYFRQLRTAMTGRSVYEKTVFTQPAPVNDGVVLENMLVQSALAPSNQFGAVGTGIPNANRPRAIDVEAASVSSSDEEDENLDHGEACACHEMEAVHGDQALLDAIASVKREMMGNNKEPKPQQKKTNETKAEKKADAAEAEKTPSTFRWVHIEIV